jgi:hypothetical protein
MPTSICAETRCARVRFVVQIVVASPYGVSFARRIASEDLLADHRRVLREPGPDGRLDPRPILDLARHLGNAAAGDHGRAVLDGLLVVREHLGAVLLADQRPDAGRRVLGAAGLHAFGLLL